MINIARIFLFLFLSAFVSTGNRNVEQKIISPGKDTLVDQDSLVGIRMKPYVVSLENFGRKDFYTWTTPEQIEELRGGKELLSRSISPKNGPSIFDIILSDSAYNGYPVAGVLREKRFAKKRFAWASGWATVMGWENENYGDQLLKISLKDTAIIVGFMPYCDTVFRYSDIHGKPLKEKFVLQHTDRIAAVYFAGRKKGNRTQMRGTYGKPKRYSNIQIDYREYIICNEKMVASWEYGTDKIKNEMKNEIEVMNMFSKYLRIDDMDAGKFHYGSVDTDHCYVMNDYTPYSRAAYCYSIAFPNDFYLMDADRIAKISATMSKALINQHAPISH